MPDLIEQVSQIAQVDDSTLEGLRREILSIEDEWTQVYSEYHTGGWLTLSLLNSTGNPTDTIIEDCTPVETSLLAKLPLTRAFLESLGLSYMWVRLAKFEPDAFFWEHRDYQEVKKVDRFRLHVPIITSPASTLVVAGVKIYLASGYVWKINPVHRHAASNFGTEARIHILADCYGDRTLNNLIEAETLDDSWISNLPSASDEVLMNASRASEMLAGQGEWQSAEHLLLKMFHEYKLGEGACYDLVSRMYRALGDNDRGELWQQNKSKFLGVGVNA